MSKKANYYFLSTLREIINSDNEWQTSRAIYKDGTPSKTKSVFGVQFRYDVLKGEAPIQTIRKIPIRDGIGEMLWIYQDQTNLLSVLRDKHKVKYWDNWDIGDGTIGKRYGYTVRKHDLVNKLLHNLETDILSKRHMINLWQEADLTNGPGLMPCAGMTRYMFTQDSKGIYYLTMSLHQRSSDFLTANFLNQTQYFALGRMIVSHLNSLKKGVYVFKEFIYNVDDCHIYDRHLELANKILDSEIIEQPNYNINLLVSRGFYDVELRHFVLPQDTEYSNNDKIEVAI